MRVPSPGALSGVIVPPYASISAFEMASPKPLPPGFARARAVAAMKAFEDVCQFLGK